MNQLTEKYAQEIQTILSKYPPDQERSAVMPLLYIAQREGGYVSKRDMVEIAECRPISKTKSWRLLRILTRATGGPE